MRASQSLARLHRDWTRLGEADPLWAVCVDPARRGGRWEIGGLFSFQRSPVAVALGDFAPKPSQEFFDIWGGGRFPLRERKRQLVRIV